MAAADRIAGHDDRGGLHGVVVKECAVGGVQIFEPPLFVMETQPGVTGRNRFVIERHSLAGSRPMMTSAMLKLRPGSCRFIELNAQRRHLPVGQ